MANKEMLKAGRYLMVSAINGVVMSAFTLAAGSRPDGDLAFDVPEGCVVIKDPGLSMVRGRKVADIREISTEDKQKVANAIEARKSAQPARKPSILVAKADEPAKASDKADSAE